MIDSDTYFHRSCEHVSKVTATGCLLFDIKISECIDAGKDTCQILFITFVLFFSVSEQKKRCFVVSQLKTEMKFDLCLTEKYTGQDIRT